MEATPSRPFVTTNLVLASVLSLEGYEPQMLVLDREGVGSDEHPQGAWQFDPDSRLDSIVAEFKEQSYMVEPEAFQKKLNHVRRELFDFLGVK